MTENRRGDLLRRMDEASAQAEAWRQQHPYRAAIRGQYRRLRYLGWSRATRQLRPLLRFYRLHVPPRIQRAFRRRSFYLEMNLRQAGRRGGVRVQPLLNEPRHDNPDSGYQGGWELAE
jgi:hypothetical protein